MVPARLAATFALILLGACGRGEVPAAADPAEAAALLVRARYDAPDAIAAGAWTWVARDSARFVFVDVQSTVEGLVQGRLDLWLVADTAALLVGRSEVMPAAAEIGAFAVDDLTRDGVPDLFGYVADSAGVRFPVFIPGAAGAMADELAPAAPSWRFATEDPTPPTIVAAAGRACALQLWAERGTPDGTAEGWRFMAILADGRLGPPRPDAPPCP